MESSSTMEQYRPPTTKLQSEKTYDVFLSFRGPDVRMTLVDHLYEALSAAGLNVFLDTEKLGKGENIDLALKKAIEGSAIRIPIFSKRYAESVWCLREAAAMLKTPGLIIPLFYNVDPTHVRYPLKETSPYKQSFDKHYGHSDRHQREEIEWWKHALNQICPFLKIFARSVRYQGKEIDSWEKALHDICSRSGWSMDITQGFEAQLVKKIVNDLIQTFDRVPLEVAKHPMGIDSIKKALVEELHLNSVKKLGIWGIGGIGKTTIAKALYNQIYADFQAASFLSNVRATAAECKGLVNLQNQILKELTKYDGEVYNVEHGKSLLRDRLKRKRVLLIVDDVDTVEQLDALVGNWLDSESRVIITSRDKHILNVAQVQYIREVSGLEIDEGLKLFSWHTFLRACPTPKYEDLSKKIVEACKGHPLSLVVIGSFLCDKKDDTGCWTEALSNITLNPGIQERLKISYNGLGGEEKEMFLDIACFFVGEAKTYPIIFWKSLYKMVDTAIKNLSMKSLIKINDKGLFDMHDHLRDMGRTIAETEKGGTRLWEATHLRTLDNYTNFSRLRLNESCSPQRVHMLCNPGLRYLHLQNLSIEEMIEDTLAMLPPSLIWLRLEKCTFAIEMDRVVKKPPHSNPLDNIWRMKIMEVINCDGLYVLPDSIGDLSQLQHLDLSDCWGLKKLPDSIGDLSQLQHLNLRHCSKVEELPNSIGNLSQLQHLNLSWCTQLKELPDSIVNLSQVQQLDLIECPRLSSLPSSIDIGNVTWLRYMN